MRVLVTGPFGYLAKELISRLGEEYQLVGLSREVNPEEEDGFPGRVFYSVNELTATENSFDLIFHLASYIPYGRFNLADSQLVTSNIELTLKLSKSYPKSKIIFSSSVSVYGDNHRESIVSEESSFNNPNMYGLSKVAGESIILNHMKFVIIRFSSIIGPDMKSQTFVPLIIENAKKKGVIILKGSGKRLQNYIDVRDAANLIIDSINPKYNNIVINGIGSRSYSNLEVAKIVSELIPCKIVYEGEDLSSSYQYKSNNAEYSTRSIVSTIEDMVLS